MAATLASSNLPSNFYLVNSELPWSFHDDKETIQPCNDLDLPSTALVPLKKVYQVHKKNIGVYIGPNTPQPMTIEAAYSRLQAEHESSALMISIVVASLPVECSGKAYLLPPGVEVIMPVTVGKLSSIVLISGIIISAYYQPSVTH